LLLEKRRDGCKQDLEEAIEEGAKVEAKAWSSGRIRSSK
jgi:hypothetical protein